MPIESYRWLMAGGRGEPLDRHLFACAAALALADPHRPLAAGLGLAAECLAALVGRYFPHAPGLLAGLTANEDGARPLAEEEPGLRALLLDHRSRGTVEEEWLAHILARRSLGPHHLWQDLGLGGSVELDLLMRQHFAPLAALNAPAMAWKKFLYRRLCDDIALCKAPTCIACVSRFGCFEPEDGRSILLPPVPAAP